MPKKFYKTMSAKQKSLLNCFTDLQRAAIACVNNAQQTEKIFIAHAQKILHKLRLESALIELQQILQISHPSRRADKLLTLGVRLKTGSF